MSKNSKGQETNDVHINSNGRARLLSVGKVIPAEWGWVRVVRTRHDDTTVWLQITKLELLESKQWPNTP